MPSGVVAGSRQRKVEAEVGGLPHDLGLGHPKERCADPKANRPLDARLRREVRRSARRPPGIRAGSRDSRSSRGRWRRERCRRAEAARPRRARARGRACSARGRRSAGSPPRADGGAGRARDASVSAEESGWGRSRRTTRCAAAPYRAASARARSSSTAMALSVVEGERVDLEAFGRAMRRQVAESRPPESRTTALGDGVMSMAVCQLSAFSDQLSARELLPADSG